jgi:hypothetical protein
MRRLSALLLMAFFLGAACAQSNPSQHSDFPLHTSQEIAAIKESALRYSMGTGSTTRIIFIDFGDSTQTDPPPGFLDRFTDLQFKLRPVSDAVFPKVGEQGSFTPSGVIDRISGRDGMVFSAHIRKWIDTDHVDVQVEMYISPIGASGTLLKLTIQDGKWTVVSKQLKWVS